MAQSVDFEIRLKAPDGSILRNLRMEVDGLGDLLRGVTRRSEEAGAGLRKMAATSVLIDTSVRAVENLKGVVSGLVAPFASFEQAMAKANTMANKSGAELKALEGQIKSLGNEIPILRDEIAGIAYPNFYASRFQIGAHGDSFSGGGIYGPVAKQNLPRVDIAAERIVGIRAESVAVSFNIYHQRNLMPSTSVWK